MKEYKYISFPSVVNAKKGNEDQAVNNYFDIVNQESVDGWEFMQVAQISLFVKKGAFKGAAEDRNVFIFVREKA